VTQASLLNIAAERARN